MTRFSDIAVEQRICLLERYYGFITARQALLDLGHHDNGSDGSIDAALSKVWALAGARHPVEEVISATTHITKKLAELKKQKAQEKEISKIEQEAEKMLELARSAMGSLKRKRDTGESGTVDMDELRQHGENMAASCKKLRSA